MVWYLLQFISECKRIIKVSLQLYICQSYHRNKRCTDLMAHRKLLSRTPRVQRSNKDQKHSCSMTVQRTWSSRHGVSSTLYNQSPFHYYRSTPREQITAYCLGRGVMHDSILTPSKALQPLARAVTCKWQRIRLNWRQPAELHGATSTRTRPIINPFEAHDSFMPEM